MKNPKWCRDEIILALDLYFKLESGDISSTNPDIIELSKILRKLPIHQFIPDPEKFRNPNGVSLKLSNFKSIDPNYVGKGMSRGSKLDKKVFHEFSNNQTELSKIAGQIRDAVHNENLNSKLYQIENPIEDENVQVQEGEVIYKLHKYRERDSSIVKKKKDQGLKKKGKLECEVCGFDFYKTYGEIGKGFIECHHVVPLSELKPGSKTKLKDLALVCANCHRMLHRSQNPMDIKKLKRVL